MTEGLKANDRLVKEDDEEIVDHGLLFADGVRECTVSIEGIMKESDEKAQCLNMRMNLVKNRVPCPVRFYSFLVY